MERRNVNRRTFLSTLAVPAAAVLILAACGDDATGDRPDVDGTDPAPSTSAPPTTAPGTTTPAPAGITHPTGTDDVVIHLAWEGGFVPAGVNFQALPRVLITGDGRVFHQGVQPAIYPGPLVPPVLVGRIDEARLQQLLAAAQDADLFRALVYEQPDNIADAADSVLVLNVNGRTFTHRAYALGIGSETNPDRAALAGFTAVLDSLVAEDLGAQPYAADRYAIQSLPAEMAMPPDGVEPNEVDWPSTAGVALADAAECAEVEAAGVQALFAESTGITRFVESGTPYVLTVRPMLPGDPGCAV